MTNAIHEANRLGQSVWYDNISRGLIKSGGLQRLIDLGVSGLTSNPTIFEKAIVGSSDYDDALLDLARAGKSADEIYEALTIEDIRAAADLLRPIYERSDGADGYASLEVSPHLAYDAEGTVVEGRRLFAVLDRPNMLIKVPATPQGITAVLYLTGEGVNVNVTLIFSLEVYHDVRKAYMAGLEGLRCSKGDVSRIASVASFFISRIDTAVDGHLQERGRHTHPDAAGLSGKAAIASAKLAYRDFEDDFGGERFAPLRSERARVQRPLWASTSTKNPDYSDVLYAESLIGPNTVDTMPESTLTAFLDHGKVASSLKQDVQDAEQVFQSLREIGINMEQVTDKLLSDGVKQFVNSYDELIANIEEKRSMLLYREQARSGS